MRHAIDRIWQLAKPALKISRSSRRLPDHLVTRCFPSFVIFGVQIFDAVAFDLEGRGDDVVVHRPGSGHQNQTFQLLMRVQCCIDGSVDG